MSPTSKSSATSRLAKRPARPLGRDSTRPVPIRSISRVLPRYRVVLVPALANEHDADPSAPPVGPVRAARAEWQMAALAELPGVQVDVPATAQLRPPRHRRRRGLRWVAHKLHGTAKLGTWPRPEHLSATEATFLIRDDVVLRPEAMSQLDQHPADIVLIQENEPSPRADRTNVPAVVRLRASAAGRLAGWLESFGSALSLRLGHATYPEAMETLRQEGHTVARLALGKLGSVIRRPTDLARFVVGSEADTLKRLRPVLRESRITELLAFDHGAWDNHTEEILSRIRLQFGSTRLVIRSALHKDACEGTATQSGTRIADIPGNDERLLSWAIHEVRTSQERDEADGQVLVQAMLPDVLMGGVISTRKPDDKAPCYVINYHDTSPPTAPPTADNHDGSRTLFHPHGSTLPPGTSPMLARLLRAVGEIESLLAHDALEIEFAIGDDGQVTILRVRPMPMTCPRSA